MYQAFNPDSGLRALNSGVIQTWQTGSRAVGHIVAFTTIGHTVNHRDAIATRLAIGPTTHIIGSSDNHVTAIAAVQSVGLRYIGHTVKCERPDRRNQPAINVIVTITTVDDIVTEPTLKVVDVGIAGQCVIKADGPDGLRSFSFFRF